MSSRALRKAQRELEEKKQQEILDAENVADEDAEEQHDAHPVAQTKSAFALLGEQNDASDSEDEDAIFDEEKAHGGISSTGQDAQQTTPKSAKKKKKRNKKRKQAQQDEEMLKSKQDQVLDDIDLALRALSTEPSKYKADSKPDVDVMVTHEDTELCKLLSVDTHYLHAENEMRRLFGRAAFERDDDQEGGGRRGGRQQAGIGGAVAGRHAAGGRNLASLGLRRNIFIQGKEEWPRATLGGLSMEVVEKRADGTIEYRFVHNRTYQDVQRQFKECVASMDPNRMVQLLQFNPYHISTLLQVSEIAKHERDRATSGELIERALFAFGKAVHSTFSNTLTAGKARLDFRRPENREFWLAAWRYIGILGQRSTWRTAFEWALLVLGLDPKWDPYCVSLIIDQFAVRARQQKKLIELWNSAYFHKRWHQLPNVCMTIGLAYGQIYEPSLARSFLKDAIEQFPWLAHRLYETLDLGAAPRGIQGAQPRIPTDELFTELYVAGAKDVWNTPEATALLTEVAAGVESTSLRERPALDMDKLDYTRHVLLSDEPTLIALLDRSLTAKVESTSDPLPPIDDDPSYTIETFGLASRDRPVGTAQEMFRELRTIQNFFASFLPWVPGTGNESNNGPIEALTPEEFQRRIEEAGVDPEMVRQQTHRMQLLQEALLQDGGGLVPATAEPGESPALRQENNSDDERAD